MKTTNFFKLPLFIIILLTFTGYTLSQAGRGRARIGGVIVDEDGNPVKSAKVVVYLLTNEQIKRETTSDKKGNWSIIGLSTGDWSITASAEGYLPTNEQVFIRQLERNPKISLKLKKVESSYDPVIKDEASLGLLDKANQLYEENKYVAAISLYEQFLKENPMAYQAHLGIGDCYKGKKDLDKAIEEYNKVLELAKKDDAMGKEMSAKALAGIGDCYMQKGNLEKAQNFFKQSIEANPENEILAYNVGEIYFANQKVEEAIHYFELSTQIKSDWGDPYLKLGYVYLNKGENTKALENFEKFLKLEPDSEKSASVQNIINLLKK